MRHIHTATRDKYDQSTTYCGLTSASMPFKHDSVPLRSNIIDTVDCPKCLTIFESIKKRKNGSFKPV